MIEQIENKIINLENNQEDLKDEENKLRDGIEELNKDNTKKVLTVIFAKLVISVYFTADDREGPGGCGPAGEAD